MSLHRKRIWLSVLTTRFEPFTSKALIFIQQIGASIRKTDLIFDADHAILQILKWLKPCKFGVFIFKKPNGVSTQNKFDFRRWAYGFSDCRIQIPNSCSCSRERCLYTEKRLFSVLIQVAKRFKPFEISSFYFQKAKRCLYTENIRFERFKPFKSRILVSKKLNGVSTQRTSLVFDVDQTALQVVKRSESFKSRAFISFNKAVPLHRE